MPSDEHAHDNTTTENEPRTLRRTPLPKLQLFILVLIQFAEPITAIVIYPFIVEFVRSTGITGGDESQTGYYAGMIESIFFLAECLTVVQFGRASDKYGRRPVLLLAPFGLAISMLGFGLSTKFWSLVVFRCLQGAFNGNIGVSKSVMAEISDSTNIAQIYAFMPLMWTVGGTMAPFIGGTFANAETRFPDTLGRIQLLRDHPYFLPCLIAGCIAFSGFAVGVFGLKETLRSAIRRNRAEEQGTEREPLLAPHSPAEEIPPLRALFIRPVFIALINHGFLAFIGMAFDVLIPLVYATPIELGGLGLAPHHIGRILATFGLLNACIQLLVAARAINYFGARTVFIANFASLTATFLAYPLLNYFARRAGGVDGWVAAVIVVQLSTGFFLSTTWACTQLFLVNAAPTPNSLGGVNGLGQMVSSVNRSLAPFIASSLFAFSSTKEGWAARNGVYWILAACGVVAVGAATRLPRKWIPEQQKSEL
ncbi:Major facilitator superfamily multidrug-resistance DHA1 sub-family [Mycena kentingensis (nom. inval.)]|nr:Major facilitator superfamily multidrug-resistance DHA1 sub-family [Mycena kentingensis (nom. inval.)]